MISTAVFSMILLIVLGAVTQIGRMYYKGLSVSRTQDASRRILDEISQQIQFSPDLPVTTGGAGFSSATPVGLCIGSTRYIVQLNKQVAGSNNVALNTQRHGLWLDDRGSPTCDISAGGFASNLQNDPPVAGVVDGRELLADGMRLVDLQLSNEGGANPRLWTVKLRVIFGDQDLLDVSNGVNQTVCSGSQVGTQFCAVSELSTTVLRRVQ